MNESRSDKNPFDLTKASDFSDSDILNYWVDLTSFNDGLGLLSILKPTLVMPMLLLGGKGSGKTHLMRFCSAPVQAMRHTGNLAKAISAEKYLGIYLLSDDLNTGRFKGKGQTDDLWSTIFSYAFELWMTEELVTKLKETVQASGKVINEQDFFTEVKALLHINESADIHSFDSFLLFLRNEQRTIDYSVNNSALTRTMDGVTIKFSPGHLVFGIPQIAERYIDDLKGSLVVYLIDEVENFSSEQQKFLNTLIRYRRGNASLKIGGRLYGVKTYHTLGSGEPIKRDAEYERVELDSILREKTNEYGKLARELILKRLNRSELRHKITSTAEIDSLFEDLDRENAFHKYSLKIVESRDQKQRERPWIERLNKKLLDLAGASEVQANEIVDCLRMPEHPLLEKLSVFLLYKRWTRLDRLLHLANEIGAEAKLYHAQRRDECPRFTQAFDHFGQDMLAQLLRECGRNGAYAGLDTLIHLSQGVPRNLLGILKHIYRNSLFAGERPFDGGTISISSQTDGIKDSANWFWDDAQPDSNGAMVREAIDSLAVLFREVRYSDKPSECDLSSFSVSTESISKSALRAIEMAENWSYLIRIRAGAKNKNNFSVDAKYQLSPMLAPRWGLSPHRGGTLELGRDLAEAIFDSENRYKLKDIVEVRISTMMIDSNSSGGEQESMF